MSAPSMMSSVWVCSAARARASCGFSCASLTRSATMARLAVAVVADQHLGGALMQLFDCGKPHQPEHFASRDDQQSPVPRATAKPSPAKPRLSLRANRSSISLMMPSPVPSSTRPAVPAQNSVPQRKPRRARRQRRLHRHRQLRRLGLGRDLHGAAARARRGLVRIHHDHVGVVELEGRRAPCGVFSLIAVDLRSGTGGRGQGGCEAARAARRLSRSSRGGRKRRKR